MSGFLVGDSEMVKGSEIQLDISEKVALTSLVGSVRRCFIEEKKE